SPALDPSAAKALRPEGRRHDPLAYVFLGLALALGLLRFSSLSTWSLWLDEALTLADVDGGGGGELNPVGYKLFGWFYGLSGARPDEFWMRPPAAVFGLASI